MQKTILLLFASLFTWTAIGSVSAQSVTVPNAGEVYTIKHVASGLYLARSLGVSNPVIKLASVDIDQQFQFQPVPGSEGTYTVMCVGYDEFLARLDAGNAWTMSWTADPNNPDSWPSSTAENKLLNAQWQIVDKGDHVVLKNLASGSYMGTDYLTDNSATYANKAETATNSQWFIAIATGEVDKTALQNKYDEAKHLFDNTSEGTGSDQYPADTRAALQTALVTARDVLQDDGAYVGDVNDALTGLIAALDAYRASVYPFQPSESATYYIQHSSNFYFGYSRTIADATYAADQQFKLTAVGNSYYTIQPVANAGEYLTRGDNGYSLEWGADGTAATAHFIVKSTGTGFYTIKCAALTGGKTEPAWFMGTDVNTTGGGVYIDKNGTDGKHYWKLVDAATMGVVKTALSDAVAKADEFLQYAVRGEDADQYPAAAYDELSAGRTAAQTVIDNDNATQADVSAATLVLNNALSACIAAVNAFAPDPAKDYSIIHYGGLYFNALDFTGYETETAKPNGINIAAKSDADNQRIKFVTVPDEAGIYNITVASVPAKYLTRCTDPHATEPDKFDDYKLIWGDDAASPYAKFEMKRVGVENYYSIRCITAGPQRTNSYAGSDAETEGSGVSIDKTATSTNHYWRIEALATNNIHLINASNVFVYSGNGKLTVSNLAGTNTIAIFNATGQLVASAISAQTEVEKQLAAGMYIVIVTGETPYRGVTTVK
ncbi:MAG: FIVAR domain-containing protein [Bacteroidales bacterium]|jgi:hypothetical protein|nr:FIVAR domain-containing protein [Bacteroidales bacterium]